MEVVKGPDNTDEQRFIQLVEQYQAALLRTCYVALGDYALAEDAVQETFLKAYQAADGYRGDCGEKTWLMKIAMNTCRDMRRRAWFRHVDRRVALEQLPEALVAYEREDDDTLQSIMRLPYRDREVLLLYFYQDMTLREIGQSLGISLGSAHTRLQRAKQKLRAALKGGTEYA